MKRSQYLICLICISTLLSACSPQKTPSQDETPSSTTQQAAPTDSPKPGEITPQSAASEVAGSEKLENAAALDNAAKTEINSENSPSDGENNKLSGTISNEILLPQITPLPIEEKTIQFGIQCDVDRCICGEKVCHFGESCTETGCEPTQPIEFEKGIELRPVSYKRAMNSRDPGKTYWLCLQDECEWNGIKFNRGASVYKDIALCSEQVIKIQNSEAWHYQCDSQKGWINEKGEQVACNGENITRSCGYIDNVCVNKAGCKCPGPKRYNDFNTISISPGDVCDKDWDCSHTDIQAAPTILNKYGFTKCIEGNCPCGEIHCGKNQTCAFGNCYYYGEINNNAAKCNFESYFITHGTSDPEDLVISTICEGDELFKLLTPPKDPTGYKLEETHFEIMDECTGSECSIYGTNIYPKLWRCLSDKCICGDKACPSYYYCGEEKCFSQLDTQLHWDNHPERSFHKVILPKQMTGYNNQNEKSWNYEGDCICNGKVLPEEARCYVTEAGTEHIICGNVELPEEASGNFICLYNSEWKCQGENCLCNGKPIPKNAYCAYQDKNNHKNAAIFCNEDIAPDDLTGYVCDDYWKRITDSKDSLREDHVDETTENSALNADSETNSEELKTAENDKKEESKSNDNSETNSEELKAAENGKKEESSKSNDDSETNSEELKAAENDNEEDSNKLVKTIRPGQNCNSSFGCLCKNEVCPVSGECTEKGCYDPLTHAPFVKENGYLVSQRLKQCADDNGCMCSDKNIQKHNYCIDDTPKGNVYSIIIQNHRAIAENNFGIWQCQNDEVVYQNLPVEAYDLNLNPDEYILKDCLDTYQRYYSDREYNHRRINQCIIKEGCQCGGQTCQFGNACISGQCLDMNKIECSKDLHEEDSLDTLGFCPND